MADRTLPVEEDRDDPFIEGIVGHTVYFSNCIIFQVFHRDDFSRIDIPYEPRSLEGRAYYMTDRQVPVRNGDRVRMNPKHHHKEIGTLSLRPVHYMEVFPGMENAKVLFLYADKTFPLDRG